jgi:7-keto-8-aminopelargonate synthetase-like enzyme
MWSRCFFVPAIRPPSVPAGRSLVRVSVAWHHTPADLDRLAATVRASIAAG